MDKKFLFDFNLMMTAPVLSIVYLFIIGESDRLPLWFHIMWIGGWIITNIRIIIRKDAKDKYGFYTPDTSFRDKAIRIDAMMGDKQLKFDDVNCVCTHGISYHMIKDGNPCGICDCGEFRAISKNLIPKLSE